MPELVGAFHSLWSKVLSTVHLIKSFKLTQNELANYRLCAGVCNHLRVILGGLSDRCLKNLPTS